MAKPKKKAPPKMKTWEGWCVVHITDGRPVATLGLACGLKPALMHGIERLARVRVTEIVVKGGKRAGK